MTKLNKVRLTSQEIAIIYVSLFDWKSGIIKTPYLTTRYKNELLEICDKLIEKLERAKK